MRDQCGARTRSGAPCRAAKVAGKNRCRMHGGAAGSAVFHVKRFGKIDDLRKRTFAARTTIRSWDFEQAECRDKV